jgi:3-phenylpropionate/cinnamic acid dioxygenase small subunit
MTLNDSFTRGVDRNRHVYDSFIAFEKIKDALCLFCESSIDNKTQKGNRIMKKLVKKKSLGIMALLTSFIMGGCANANRGRRISKFDVEDRLEIVNLINTFSQYLDNNEIENYASCYTEEGFFAIVNKDGKQTVKIKKNELVPFFAPRFQIFKDEDKQRRHFYTNISIREQTQNKAVVRMNALLTSTNSGKLVLITTMTYDCVVIKTANGDWKFKEVYSNLDSNLDAKVSK